MSYSSSISISALHASIYEVSCASLPPCGERRLPLVRFRARRNYNNQYPPYVLKKRPHSDLKLPLATQTLPRLSYLSGALSLEKHSCQTLIYMKRSFPENSSNSTSQIRFGSHLKHFTQKTHFFILFQTKSLFAWVGQSFTLPGLVFLHSPSASANCS